MTQTMATGNSIRPLRNVAAFATLIKRLQERAYGLPGMGTFSGPPGVGKSFAAAFAAANLDAIHISVQEMWTKKTLLQMILKELREKTTGTRPELLVRLNQALTLANRPLIIDEADYCVDNNMVMTLRDIHDGSHVPVVLIGMEDFPQKLRKWELVDSRVLSRIQAEPADLRDAKLLAVHYAPGIDLGEDLIEHIRDLHFGIARRMVTDFAHVVEHCQLEGLAAMSLQDWGNRRFAHREAPKPRGIWS